MTEPILAKVMSSLDMVVLQRMSGSSFKILCSLPAWFSRVYTQVNPKNESLKLEGLAPFLDAFLLIAEPFWRDTDHGRLKSGSWNELEPFGEEHRLEALAISLGDTKILLIESFGLEFDEQKSLLQTARETRLANEYLTKDLQHKQMLGEKLAHEMSESLAGIDILFSSLDPGKLSPDERRSLERSKRRLQRLEILIGELKETFTLIEREPTRKDTTLLYGVEQVFLIHRETGLLLQHVSAPGQTSRDPDLVSGMLTAIQDRVHQSIGSRGEGLEKMRVGDLTVCIERGPQVLLAVVVRGEFPEGWLRGMLHDTLEKISIYHSEALDQFTGNTAEFDGCRRFLEGCLAVGGEHTNR